METTMYTDTTKSPMNSITQGHLKSTISVEVLPSKTGSILPLMKSTD